MYKSSFTLDALHRSLLESEIWLDFHPVLHFVGGAVNLNVCGEKSHQREECEEFFESRKQTEKK